MHTTSTRTLSSALRLLAASSIVVVSLGACRSDPPDGNDGDDTPVANVAPVANDASATTANNASVSGILSASDANGDALQFRLISPPSNGQASITATGEFSYDPNNTFSGTDTFTFRVNDGTVDSNTATVTITVRAANNAPVASNQSITTDFQTQAMGMLMASDADGDNLTFTRVAQAANGTATVNTDGSFTYNPDAGFSGTDQFTFRANDGQTPSNTATVTVQVNPQANRAPTATAAMFATPTDTQLSESVTGTDPDNDTLTFAVVDMPATGTLALMSDGSFTYDPAAGSTGTVSFTFTANDGMATSQPATATIEIGNASPVADDQTFTGNEDELLTATVVATDANNDTLTFSNQSAPMNGELRSFNTMTGEFTYLPERDFEGSDTFTVQVSDGRGGSDTATITLTIACPNINGECDFDKLPLADNDGLSGARNPSLIVQTPAPNLPDVTRPYVAFIEAATANQSNLFVRRFTGGTWETVDDADDNNDTVDRMGMAAMPDLSPAILLPLTVVVAWDEDGDIFVDRYSDSQPNWANISGIPNQGDASGATVAVSTLSQPLVAFVDNAATNTDAVIYANTGNTAMDGNWLQLDSDDGALDVTNTNPVNQAAIAADDLVGVGLGSLGGRPIVAFSETVGGVQQIFVQRCPDTNNGLTDCDQLGPALNIDAAVNANNPAAAVAAFAIDVNVRPVVAFDEAGDVYVRRYDQANNVWVTLGGGAVDIVEADVAINPSVAVDILGRIVVSWQEIDSASGTSRVYAKRYSDATGVFEQLGSILNCDIDQNATDTDVAFDTLARPYIAFVEEVPVDGGATDTRVVVMRFTQQ